MIAARMTVPTAMPLPAAVSSVMAAVIGNAGAVPPAQQSPGDAWYLPGMLRSNDTLELYDLDGTLTTPSFESPEGQIYLGAAAKFVAEQIPAFNGRERDVLEGVQQAIKHVVFPNRHRPRFWAEFPTVQNRAAQVCPSVDHYLLTQFGMRVFLEGEVVQAGGESPLTSQVTSFLANPQWANQMYGVSSKAAETFSRMDDDARWALEQRLTNGKGLMAIFTNSSVEKARAVVNRAGLGRYVVENQLQRGRLALIGNGRKAVIDEAWAEAARPSNTRWGDAVDVTLYFGETASVDLRRGPYYQRAAQLMTESGARQVWMAGDMAALELLPLANWTDFHPTVVMRRTPMSAPQEERVVTELIGGRVVDNLSEAVAGLE